MTNMWLPPSYLFRGLKAVQDAVRQYDANLDFGKNEATGQWCVFLKHGTMAGSKDNDLPILGFSDIPHPDDVLKRLYQSDALRRGQEIVDDIQKHNDDLLAERESTYKDVDGNVAEHFAWGSRKMGHPNAPIQVFVRR